MTDKKPLCYAPFIHMRASSFGYSPCCVYTEAQSAESPDAYWKSEHLKTIRKQLLDGQFPSGCSLCKYNKDHGTYVQTTQFDTMYFYNHVEINVEKGNTTGLPVAVEYKPSNRCNLACRMCRPSDSDMIEKEAKKYNLINRYNDNKYPKIDPTPVEDYIIANKIKKVAVLGGETALDTKAIAFLEKLDKSVRIQSTTNATTLNKKYAAMFKDINLVLSVDGVGKTYEYIRTNAKWHITEQNIYTIFNTYTPKTVCINFVMTPYNVFNLEESLLWFDRLENTTRKPFNVYFSDSDDYVTKLNVVLDKHIDSVVDQLYASSIKKTERLFEVLRILQGQQHDEQAHKKFVEYNNKIDSIRKTNLLDLDERFASYV